MRRESGLKQSRTIFEYLRKIRKYVDTPACVSLNGLSLPGATVNHHQLEKDIEHLEHVIARLSGQDRIPLSYWRGRVESVMSADLVPSQVQRVKRLKEALCELEQRVDESRRR